MQIPVLTGMCICMYVWCLDTYPDTYRIFCPNASPMYRHLSGHFTDIWCIHIWRSMYTCTDMYVFMDICTRIWMQVCMYKYQCTSVDLETCLDSIHMSGQLPWCIYDHKSVCNVCVCMQAWVLMYVCTCTSISTYVWMYSSASILRQYSNLIVNNAI